jgi:hypothetical protein
MSAFDGLTFKQGLTKVGFPDDQAEALSALIRDHVVGNAATKDDLLGAEQRLNEKIERVQERLKAEMTLLRSEMKQSEQRMTIRLGSMVAAAVVLIVAAEQFSGP